MQIFLQFHLIYDVKNNDSKFLDIFLLSDWTCLARVKATNEKDVDTLCDGYFSF